MKHSAYNIAAFIFAESDARAQLCQILMDGATTSATAIRGSTKIIDDSDVSRFDKAVSFLTLKSHVMKQTRESEIDDSLSKNSNSIYDSGCATIPYHQAAALAEIQAYQDAMDLCNMKCFYTKGEVMGSIDSKLTIISKYDSKQAQIFDTDTPQFLWMPRTVDAFRRGFAKVNKEWYLLHQVVLVVHSLASVIDWGPGNEEQHYTLEKLCLAVGVDRRKAEAIIASNQKISSQTNKVRSPIKARKSLGRRTSPVMRTSPRSINTALTKTSRKSNTKIPKAKAGSSVKKPKKKIKNPSPGSPKLCGKIPSTSISERTTYDGPDGNFPGWNKRSIRRNNSEHVDHVWYKPDYPDIVVRSQTGVNQIIQTMLTKDCDFISACSQLVDSGSKTFFMSTAWKRKYT